MYIYIYKCVCVNVCVRMYIWKEHEIRGGSNNGFCVCTRG